MLDGFDEKDPKSRRVYRGGNWFLTASNCTVVNRGSSRLARVVDEAIYSAKALEDQLADPDLYNDLARSRDIVAEYERVRAELESMWERLAELG